MSKPATVTDIIVLEENRANRELFAQLEQTAKEWGGNGLFFLSGDGMVKKYVRDNCHPVMVIIRSFASSGPDKGQSQFVRATNLRDKLIASGAREEHVIILNGDETPEAIDMMVREAGTVDVVL